MILAIIDLVTEFLARILQLSLAAIIAALLIALLLKRWKQS